MCGLIAHYSAVALPKGPDHTPLLMSAILTKRLTFRGFIVIDFASQKAEFERDMAAWLRERKVKYREDIVDGLENAVGAFRGLLLGKNFGKLLVRVARQGWGFPNPMMPQGNRQDFEDLEASQLYCPACKRAMPVRKRLLLVLLDRETSDYVCAGCGSVVGKKEQPLRRLVPRPRI